MALRTRRDVYDGLDTRIRTSEIYPASRLLSSITGVAVQPNKAIVGDNAFAHEAGIHQDGVLKAAITYEIMTPQSIGRASNELVLGKHSGRHAFRDRLAELGFDVEGDEFDAPSSASRPWPTRRRPSTTRTSRRSWPSRRGPTKIASPSKTWPS